MTHIRLFRPLRAVVPHEQAESTLTMPASCCLHLLQGAWGPEPARGQQAIWHRQPSCQRSNYESSAGLRQKWELR